MSEHSSEEISVVATGAQDGKDFPRLDTEHPIGMIFSPWRCNLTGLSQVHNLFFAARRDIIFCYVPRFPDQKLPTDPALLVVTEPSGPGLRGYIDRDCPHSINRLVVQFLGNEEVIATVRDDGDVELFLIRHIVHAIEQRVQPGNTLDIRALELRPFFHENVGKSAWGLAIHCQARILAVSANTTKITIFRFGLIDQDDSGNVGDENVDKSRKLDVRSAILNGGANIPDIAFCNTGDDPEARWLLSTDISGVSRTIDLRHPNEPFQMFSFGDMSTGQEHISNHDPLNAGWGIMFLDRRAFIEEDDFHAALGLGSGESLSGISYDALFWDISATAAEVPDRSRLFLPPQRQLPPLADMASDDDSDPLGGDDMAIEENEEMSDIEQPANDEELAGDDEVQSLSDSQVVDMDDPRRHPPAASSRGDRFQLAEALRPTLGHEARFLERKPPCDDLPCAILHSSVCNAYLLQPSRADDGQFAPLTIGFSGVLRMAIDDDPLSRLAAFERLNMSAVISALGVVVLASQKGCAVVLSLTKLSRSTAYPREMSPNAWGGPGTPIYAMRLERLLPLASQEQTMQLPNYPLAGLAVGPIQGTDGPPSAQRRWRLIMTYLDGSTISYEISRRRARDSGLDLASVVV